MKIIGCLNLFFCHKEWYKKVYNVIKNNVTFGNLNDD